MVCVAYHKRKGSFFEKKLPDKKDGAVTIEDNFICAALAILLAVACYTDLRYRKLPNYLIFSGMAVGIFYHAFWGSGFLFAGKGLFLGIAFLFIPYVLGGMGAGDVKLLGAVGAFIGAAGVCKAFIFTAIAGGIHAIIFMGINGYLGAAVKRYGLMLKGFIVTRKFIYVPPPEALREKKLFYGVAIVIGTLCSVIFSHVL